MLQKLNDYFILNSDKTYIYSFIFLMIYAIYTSFSKVIHSLNITGDLPFIEIDSFWFLNQAKAILFNTFSLNYNDIYSFDLYGYLLAFTHYLTGVNLEIISFYSPILFSVLTVIIILLLFKDNRLIGFFTALLLMSSSTYVFRTSVGYSDTDSGIVFFIFLFIYSLMKLKKEFVFISAFLFHWWYLNATIILFPIIVLFFIFNYKKNKELTIDISFFAITALLPLHFSFKFVLILFYNYLKKYQIWFLILTLILFSYNLFFKIFNKVTYYLNPIIEQKLNIPSLVEDSTRTTETRLISFVDMLHYTGIEIILFNAAAIIGFCLASYFYKKEFVYFIPIFLLGLIGLISGVRFFLYLEIALALGLSYLIYLLYLNKKLVGITLMLVVSFFSIKNINYGINLDLFPSNNIKDSLHNIKDISSSINKDSNIVLLQWGLGHIFSFYSDSLTSRNGAYHTALMNYFSLNNFINKNETEFINNYTNYFNEYRNLIKNKEPFFNIDKFIKYSIQDKIELPILDKDMYVLIPFKITNDLFKDLGTNETLKHISIDPVRESGNGIFAYIEDNKPKHLLFKDSELHEFNKDNKEVIVNEAGHLNLLFMDKYIVTYDKSIKDSFLITLLSGKSNNFELIKVNKEFVLFKLKGI